MSETLYPHEQVIKVLITPNSYIESLVWYIYGLSSSIILYFVSVAFGYIVEAENIIIPMKFQNFIIFGLNLDCYLCFILMILAFAGIVIPDERGLN